MPTHYDYYSGIFDSLFSFITESAFLLSKGLSCLYDKQNNTWLLGGMEFLFSCSARHLTRSLSSLLRLTLEEKFHIYARPGLLRAYGKFLARRAPSHDGCNFTSAESSR